jgi:hypothetical protein
MLFYDARTSGHNDVRWTRYLGRQLPRLDCFEIAPVSRICRLICLNADARQAPNERSLTYGAPQQRIIAPILDWQLSSGTTGCL